MVISHTKYCLNSIHVLMNYLKLTIFDYDPLCIPHTLDNNVSNLSVRTF